MDLNNVIEVEKELKRFFEKLKEAKQRLKDDEHAYQGCKETGALKRSALDLKQVLTKNLK